MNGRQGMCARERRDGVCCGETEGLMVVVDTYGLGRCTPVATWCAAMFLELNAGFDTEHPWPTVISSIPSPFPALG